MLWVAWKTTVSKYCSFPDIDAYTHTHLNLYLHRQSSHILVRVICHMCHMQKRIATHSLQKTFI